MLIRTDRDGGNETVLLDANAMAEGKAYFHLGGSAHSPDHRLLAYASDEMGSEYFEIRIRDLATGEDLPDRIPGTSGDPVWAADSRTLLYVWLDANHRPAKVFRHTVGTDPSEDVVVFEDANPAYFLGVGKTQSDRFIVIDSHDHETSEAHVLPADDPAGTPRLVAPRRAAEKLRDRRVRRAVLHPHQCRRRRGLQDRHRAGRDARPRTLAATSCPTSEGRLILSHTAYKDWLTRLEREGGLPRIVIRNLATGEEHRIDFDEEAYSLGMMGGYEFDTDALRFTYSSMTTPARVYDYDMATRAARAPQGGRGAVRPRPGRLRDAAAVRDRGRRRAGAGVAPLPQGHAARRLGAAPPLRLRRLRDHDPRRVLDRPAVAGRPRLRLRHRPYPRRQGQGLPLVRRRTAARRRSTPSPTSSRSRGSSRRERYTSAGKIVGWGGSAGGLLIGAVANMAPELFAGLIAEVPFVDVLDTMLDDTLPLTPPEWPEWGNPIVSEADFRTILAYSPYDNVTARPYPAILAMAGLTDPRVTYWEPAKWVAKLRAHTTGDRPILLRTNLDAGHGGAAGRFDRLQESAFATAFALKVAGKA